MSLQPQSDLLAQIRDLIHQYFDLSEFRDLCNRLGISYYDLPGENLPDRMWELVLRVNREGRLDYLLSLCAHLRPNVAWPELAQHDQHDQWQSQRKIVYESQRRLLVWGLSGGILLSLFVLFFIFRSVSNGIGNLEGIASMPLREGGKTPAETTSDTSIVEPIPIPMIPPAPDFYIPPSSGQLGDEWERPQDGMVMVYVPLPGESFELKSGADVPTQEFWIDKHTVTNAQYQLCVNEGDCQPSLFANNDGFNGDNYPVIGISWFDATNYVTWLNKSVPIESEWIYYLPTEGEWEYAAAGEAGAVYPWGNEEINCELANYDYCVDSTSELGSYPDGASWVGALDMAGNVWEWTNSRYEEDPQHSRVKRGGSWNHLGILARTDTRQFDDSRNYVNSNGLRIVVRRLSNLIPIAELCPACEQPSLSMAE
ncbi:MAG: SUMF1/EgtB/PvdO family nonheme iron enzyme [Chloroflexota bacterium]